MKKTRIYKIASISLAIIFALNLSVFANTNAYQTQQERDVPAFSELNLSISANVYLKQGTKQKVEIQASEKLLKLIETEVKGNALSIKWNKRNVRHSEKIKIYITMTDVNALRISGSGDIIAEGPISTTDLVLKISGSGDIKLDNVKAKNIASKISGSADISINGPETVEELSIAISGSGDIKAQDLEVRKVTVAISGSGNCKINATESLKARVAGSGDVYYKGSATIDAKVSGSGSIKHLGN